MMQSGDQVYKEAFLEGFKPDTRMTVSEWADEHRYLSSKSSAEPGRWRTSRTPYLRAIMDVLSVSNPVNEIVFMKGAQIGGTEAALSWVGFIIDHAPAPAMLVQPTTELGKRLSKQRLEPLIDECPRLKLKVADSRSRDSGNTMLSKDFPNGVLVVTGANSAVGLRSMAVRYLMLDEIDAYPDDVDGEGDPVSLAEARTRTFFRRKIFKISTPTIEGRSKIQTAYELSNQQEFHVPCPYCGHFQPLRWDNMRYDPKNIEKSVKYECERCEKGIGEHYKTAMLAAGKWVAKAPENEKIVGFHLSSLYSPVGWYSWADAANDYEKARVDVQKLRVFQNTVLGLPYRERGDAPSWNRLYERREDYPLRTVPAGGLVLTAGVDVQRDRIETEIIAWGRDKQTWSIDYVVIAGDTSTRAPWDELAKLVTAQFPHESAGVMMPIKMMAIDSGYNTQQVYEFVRRFPPSRVIAVKGQDGLQTLVGQPRAAEINSKGKRITTSFKVWPVGVSVAKMEFYGWLRLDSPTDGKPYPHGFCHFPEYGPEYFQMLTAEEMQRRVVRGFATYQWVKVRERNESLDTRVYSRAAAAVAGIDRWQDATWDDLEEQLGVGLNVTEQTNLQVQTKAPAKTAQLARKKSKFWE